jgi:CheY-like chemotaxis protein
MEQQKHSVLIVEDVQDWRLTLRGLLQEAGFVVVAVASSKEARMALQRSRYDAALLDIRLDERDENDDEGLALAEEINHSWPNVKVFITTGYANDDYIRRAMEPRSPGGKRLATNFIKKSDTKNLVGIIKQALNE